MKKLIKGIVEFRQKTLPSYQETFARLALGQAPDALFIACSDSRVVPNLFASTDPGDLFVIRNIGNIVPCCDHEGHSPGGESPGAAIEFALLNLSVSDIIVCGHSECGAMRALIDGRGKIQSPNLNGWLRHGEDSVANLSQAPNAELSEVNRLSQVNVLQQLEHLRSYPVVQERLAAGKLSLHGWWFEIATATVYSYNENSKKFEPIS